MSESTYRDKTSESSSESSSGVKGRGGLGSSIKSLFNYMSGTKSEEGPSHERTTQSRSGGLRAAILAHRMEGSREQALGEGQHDDLYNLMGVSRAQIGDEAPEEKKKTGIFSKIGFYFGAKKDQTLNDMDFKKTVFMKSPKSDIGKKDDFTLRAKDVYLKFAALSKPTKVQGLDFSIHYDADKDQRMTTFESGSTVKIPLYPGETPLTAKRLKFDPHGDTLSFYDVNLTSRFKRGTISGKDHLHLPEMTLAVTTSGAEVEQQRYHGQLLGMKLETDNDYIDHQGYKLPARVPVVFNFHAKQPFRFSTVAFQTTFNFKPVGDAGADKKKDAQRTSLVLEQEERQAPQKEATPEPTTMKSALNAVHDISKTVFPHYFNFKRMTAMDAMTPNVFTYKITGVKQDCFDMGQLSNAQLVATRASGGAMDYHLEVEELTYENAGLSLTMKDIEATDLAITSKEVEGEHTEAEILRIESVMMDEDINWDVELKNTAIALGEEDQELNALIPESVLNLVELPFDTALMADFYLGLASLKMKDIHLYASTPQVRLRSIAFGLSDYFKLKYDIFEKTVSGSAEYAFPEEEDSYELAGLSIGVPIIPGLEAGLEFNLGFGFGIEGAVSAKKESSGWRFKEASINAEAQLDAALGAFVAAGNTNIVAIALQAYADFIAKMEAEMKLKGGFSRADDSSTEAAELSEDAEFTSDFETTLSTKLGAKLEARALRIFRKTLYKIETKEYTLGEFALSVRKVKGQPWEFNYDKDMESKDGYLGTVAGEYSDQSAFYVQLLNLGEESQIEFFNDDESEDTFMRIKGRSEEVETLYNDRIFALKERFETQRDVLEQIAKSKGVKKHKKRFEYYIGLQRGFSVQRVFGTLSEREILSRLDNPKVLKNMVRAHRDMSIADILSNETYLAELIEHEKGRLNVYAWKQEKRIRGFDVSDWEESLLYVAEQLTISENVLRAIQTFNPGEGTTINLSQTAGEYSYSEGMLRALIKDETYHQNVRAIKSELEEQHVDEERKLGILEANLHRGSEETD
ncbi:MAG: hypothetical protein JXO44_02485, partial [Clostridia bacterium]|nr:hypothetical protein [Clostridia bacterium]